MTDVKDILSHIDYLMSNHDSSLDYEAALEDVRSFILERKKTAVASTRTRRKRSRNCLTQFELRAKYGTRELEEEYQWCVENLPLRAGRAIVYQVDEIYIITSSQKVIDKVNEHFGTTFSFENFMENRVFYL